MNEETIITSSEPIIEPVASVEQIAEIVIDNTCQSCKGIGRSSPQAQCDTCLGTGITK